MIKALVKRNKERKKNKDMTKSIISGKESHHETGAVSGKVSVVNETIESPVALVFSEPRLVNTVRGTRNLRTAKPDGKFWAQWNREKARLQAIGISVSKDRDDQWQVCWWQVVESATTLATETQAESSPATVLTAVMPSSVSQAAPVKMSDDGTKWSDEQKAIFAWFENGKGSMLVRARAGTGKTTTIKKAFSFAPEERMLYAVFNKKNQREASGKITDGRVDVKTLHSVGFACILSVWSGSKPDPETERSRLESIQKDLPDEVAGAVLKLVSFAKNTTINPSIADIVDIAVERDINSESYSDEEAGGWTQMKLAQTALQMLTLAKTRDAEKRISFDDMVWLPVVMNWVRPIFDLVVVDEAQDMSLPQLTMAMRACKPGGRICVVGDDRQAIYGFRGAAQGGMEMMKTKLNAAELGLTTTYRCPKKVVALAQALVPDYKVADSAPEGIVDFSTENAMLDLLRIEDAVLSRINAPLMPLCLQLLRKGVPARIEGRDIGKQLANLAKKMKAKSVPDFIRRVESWGVKQRKRVGNSKNSEAKLEQINDQVLTLVAVAEGTANVNEIFSRLLSLFQDTEEGSRPAVVFSSVHKAKGLEWDRVFLLSKTFNRKSKGGPTKPSEASEEQNIYYVALTRAKKHLVLCAESPKNVPTVVVAEAKTGTEQTQNKP